MTDRETAMNGAEHKKRGIHRYLPQEFVVPSIISYD
jgi:hypothetical protein